MPSKIEFLLQKITTEQFAVIESAYSEDKDVQFTLNIKYGINEQERIIAVHFTPEFCQDKTPFIVLETSCFFKIRNQAWDAFKNKDKTKLTVPVGFIRHLIMLTVGTARGVLHSKTENTLYNNFLIPTINVTEIIDSGVTFELQLKSS